MTELRKTTIERTGPTGRVIRRDLWLVIVDGEEVAATSTKWEAENIAATYEEN